MSIIGDKFTKKYAPKSLDELIIPGRIRQKIEGGAKQHLLFYGSPGTGKTSTAIAIAKTYDIPYMYIDASTETSVDILREKISKFCSTMSIMDGPGASSKIVILDEVDGVSDQFNKALKATIERFEHTTRFIATTNHINKVPDTVLSRFEQINYDFSEEEEKEIMRGFIKRIHGIASNEGMSFTKDALVEFVKRKFPDMRSMLNSLQGYYDENKRNLTIEDIKKFHGVYKDIYDLIFKNEDPVENYKYLVSNYSNKVDDVLATLGNEFIEYIQMEHSKYASKIPQIIVKVAEHQAQRVHVIDPVVSMLSCVYGIQTLLKT
jgi:DNA polymerase III delta prime subunit